MPVKLMECSRSLSRANAASMTVQSATLELVLHVGQSIMLQPYDHMQVVTSMKSPSFVVQSNGRSMHQMLQDVHLGSCFVCGGMKGKDS